MIATATAVAFIVYSCKGKLGMTDAMDLENTPVQTARDMFMVQTENGKLQNRMEAAYMERYQNDSISYDLFPEGIAVYSYTAEGLLETEITANAARHVETEDGEIWEAFGDVVVKNLINQQVMETDTLYWDQEHELIYTDCYVEMYSPQGFMQGYGMESDQRAQHSVIKRPFNSYGFVEQDSTMVYIDSANFIGPLLKK